MKQLLALAFGVMPFFAFSQVVDTAAVIRQVDSMVQVCRTLTGQSKYDDALQVIETAKKKATEVLGVGSAEYASCVFNQGRVFYFMGKYPEAEPLYLEAKVIREKVLGKEHLDYASSLNSLANVYTAKSEYDKAVSLYDEVKAIREKVLGKEHSDYAAILNNLARVYENKAEYPKAILLHLEAKAIREKVLGKEHRDYTSTVNDLANVYRAKGEYDKALSLHLEAKAIREKVLGKDHPDYASSLNNLANVYWPQGEYEKALPLYLEAKVIWEKTLGKEHPSYATILYNLANVYRAKGEYDKAVSLHLEAKSIREKVLGKEHPDYAAILNTLGLDYSDKGEYDKALLLYLEAKVIWEKALGKEHPLYITSLNNLANVYRAKGEYEKALFLYLETKAIREKALGKEHSDYASILNNLASVYRDKGEYEKALPLYLEAKVIWEKVLGKEHPDYATSLNNLANVYWAKGEYDKALPLYLEAKALREKVSGKEHPLYALSLTNLAGLYKDIREYHKALPLYLEGKAIQEKVLGKQHPDYANSLYNLASTYRDKGDHIKAASYFLSSNTVAKSLLQKSAAYSSEKEMLQYQALFQKRFDALLSFAQTYLSDSLIFAAFDNALFLHNAQVFNASAREKSIAQADSSTRSIHAEWKSCHFQLAKQYALPIADRDSARVARLEEQANEYEKELARHSPDFVESQQVLRWQEVRDRLQAGEAAIEFVHYRYYDQNATDSTIYAALVLRPGDDAPHWVTLFEEGQLRALLGHPQAGKADFINQLYDSTALYELVWEPLERWLDGATRIYYAPSGLLHRLSPDAFQYAEKQVLAERYALHRLGSTRQLVTESPTLAFATEDAVVYGGVRYEMDSIAIAAANQTWIFEENAEPGGFGKLRGSGGNAWGYLKWTEIEAKSVAELLTAAGVRVEIRQGYTATEESFAFLGKKSAAPKVLHLATHAFFFSDPKESQQSPIHNPQFNEPIFKMSEHPMMRSGLVFAGVNHAWTGGKPLEGMEDGILTAYEISQMNLSGTELAVLSACETGLGDIEGNEGVYGLQRAFKIAGAKYLVMSLWQVPDYETEELMTAFYTEWLTGKKSIPEAFRSAQRQVRAEHPDTFNWAGFVLVE